MYCIAKSYIAVYELEFILLILSLHTGIVSSYVVIQTGVWAVLDAVFFFWAIVVPFSYRQFKEFSGKVRIAHIISVLLGLFVPLPSALLPLVDGHSNDFSIVLYCTPTSENYIYYTLTFPLSIFAGISTFLQIYTTWTLFKVAVSCGSYMARDKVLNIDGYFNFTKSMQFILAS